MDAAHFRRIELALIQLNDERRGGVITMDQYLARRAKVLDGTGVTEEMLKDAPVYGDDAKRNDGTGMSWAQLRWKRRNYNPPDEGT